MNRARYVTIVGVLFLATAPEARQPKSLLVDLKFVPQESVRNASVALPMSALQQPMLIEVADARDLENLRAIGTGTDDDDRPFPIQATVDVPKFVADSVMQIAKAYSIKSEPDAGRKLTLRLTRFNVNESNKAIGSTYAAEVHLAYALTDGSGTLLAEGAASGSANRYGRARSSANCSEVLSDALKESFVKLIGDQTLQAAWKSGVAQGTRSTGGAAAPDAPRESIEERLRRAEDLFKRKVITEEEYKKMRADILKSGD